jgi:hypothetical protein
MVPITLGRGALCYTSLYCISINIPRYFSADIENLSSVVISVYRCKVSVQSYIDIFSSFFSATHSRMHTFYGNVPVPSLKF